MTIQLIGDLCASSILVAAILAVAGVAQGAKPNEPRFVHQGKEITKIEAIVILAKEPGAIVERCVPQMLNEKGAMVQRK